MPRKTNIISKILGSKTPSPVTEIEQAKAQLAKRRKEIDARLAETEPPGALGGGGADRQRVLTEGSPEEVVKMDAEREQLKAELKQLEYQELRLRERLKEAESDEARKSLPASIKALPGVLDQYEQAKAAMEAAERELNSAVQAVGSARNLVGDDAPAVPDEVVERIAAARGLAEPEGRFSHSSERAWLFKQLTGQLSPRLREQPATPSSIRRSERFGRDERDDRQRRRQPENSIWRRKDDDAA
jgi:hypothetical protein